MRFLLCQAHGDLILVEKHDSEIPPYAVLSHTWGADNEEVTFKDLTEDTGKNKASYKKKAGYKKIEFCREQAARDGLQHFWVDTCCIDKSSSTELMEAINSMFRWYQDAAKCYVFLADVSTPGQATYDQSSSATWQSAFQGSRWFGRGWTLQELIAPASVEFFSCEGNWLGSKRSLEQHIHNRTGIPIRVLHGESLDTFDVEERFSWARHRKTGRQEDEAYSLLGIFNVRMRLDYGEGRENAFERLRKKIGKSSKRKRHQDVAQDTLLLVSNVHWTVSRSTNTLFTGRDIVLGKLETIARDTAKILSHQDQCRVVITGMGGQGKSEICLQLAFRVRQSFWGVFWVDVSTAYLAESAFLDIASRLQISAQTWEDGRQGLANMQQPWLLVLDNADDPYADYQRYIPASSSGVVMLTSRNEQCKQYATEEHIHLNGLPDIEARELLLSAAGVPRRQRQMLKDDAEVVASLLQSHPLALILAGSYISRGHCTLAQYSGVFAQQRQRLLTFKLTQAQSRYRDVYATFEASAEILQSSHSEGARDALQLLPVLATCGPSRLPLPLFEAGWRGAQSVSPSTGDDDNARQLTPWHVSRLLPLVQAGTNAWDSFRLIEAIDLLKAFSLVSTDLHSGFLSVSMHPLTHAWARDRQEMAEQHESWVKTGCLVAISRSRHDFWRQHGRQLQAHVQALTGWAASGMFASEPLMKITSILVNCGWLLYDMRDDAKVFILMNSLLTHLSLDRKTVNGRWLEVYELTAWNLVNYGKIKEAVSLLEQVVKIREQTLAEDHPSRLASQHVLAGAYQANGQVKEAVSLLEQVVKIEEQTLAKDHPSRLASQHALAIAYEANGQVKEAVSLLEQVVKIKEQTLAEDHLDRLASQHTLAIAYESNGQVKEAVSLLEQVVKIQEQILAEDHPSRLASQHELAIAYQANGQVKEAVSLLEQVVMIREQTLAEDHPDRLASQHALAIAYEANGQVKEAVSLLEQVVKIQEQTLAEDHPSRLASQHELAIAYQANGQVKEAVSLLEQVVMIREQTLAEDHPDRLASQQVLATMYWNLDRRNAALQMMKRVVEIRRQALDERHPNRMNSESWLKQFEREIRKEPATYQSRGDSNQQGKEGGLFLDNLRDVARYKRKCLSISDLTAKLELHERDKGFAQEVDETPRSPRKYALALEDLEKQRNEKAQTEDKQVANGILENGQHSNRTSSEVDVHSRRSVEPTKVSSSYWTRGNNVEEEGMLFHMSPPRLAKDG